ncbi:MAG: dual specificity protein phosphatase family protein [Candidatus Binatia bacterium]
MTDSVPVVAVADATAETAADCAYDWITPRLAIGGCLDPSSGLASLRGAGIGAVVDLRVEEADDAELLGRHDIQLLRLPTRDCCAVSLRALSRGVAWVNQQTRSDRRVYVHCQHGIGRSALLVACVLVSRSATPIEALQTLKRARPRVSPSLPQLRALVRWSRRFHGAALPQQPIGALARVAWSGV